MHVLTVRCDWRDSEILSAELWERGTLGLQERELPQGQVEIEAYFEERFELADWPGVVSASWKAAPPAASSDDWKKHWQPLAVGEKLWLVPSWRDDPPPAGRIAVRVYAGRASGSGQSEPTQLMLKALERYLEPQATVADIGTGSGILSAAARALGAGRVFACDIDEEAALLAATNWADAGVQAAVWCGSARSLASKSADLVVANLNAEQLILQARDLTRILRPGGRLILGGFQERRETEVVAAFRLEPLAELRHGAWRGAVLIRRAG